MPKSNHPSAILRRRHRNAVRGCLAPGCPQLRAGLSGYCTKHAQRVALYGHPNGKRLMPREYIHEHAEASAFLEHHKTHPGIVSALAWLGDWLRDSSAGLNVPARYEFHRLNTAGVSALDVLTESLAVWLYISRNASRFPNARAVDCALGTCVLYMVKRFSREVWKNGKRTMQPERINGTKRRTTGERIRKTLGVLFLNIEKAMTAEHEEQIHRAQSMAVPFTNPQPTTQQK